MIRIDNVETFGYVGALRGMRNAKNSWDRNDSYFDDDGFFVIGPNDLKLLLALCRAGRSHRKVLRMLHIQMDITAPLYWWKDYDTYKVGTVANSCSTMHMIHTKQFEMSDFSFDMMADETVEAYSGVVTCLEMFRNRYVESGLKDKEAWYSMIQMLPTSYMQKRTIDITYETALSIILDRENHKLYEFRHLCEDLKMRVPYMIEIYNAVKER